MTNRAVAGSHLQTPFPGEDPITFRQYNCPLVVLLYGSFAVVATPDRFGRGQH